MGEALNGLKRTMMCGEPREVNVGEKITLMGWVQRNRKLGGLQFIDLRDRTGIMQIVFGEEINAESFEKAKAVRPEYCVAVTGEVVLREAPNASMETGMVELKCESIKVLSESETPPIYIKEGLDAAENIRLKYRYLDLRRPDMQKIFMIRNRTTKAVRDYLDNNGFLEIETPILNKSTPEGARDYYNAAIREKEDFYNKASATYAEISGKRDTAEKDLYQANKDIMRVTQQINACLDENKENEAMQYAMKKSTLENKINVLKDTIEEMKEAQTHQKDIRDQAAEELQKLKEEKEQVLFQMEADSQIIELHQSMDSLNTNNESDRMLERVREGARKTRERAEGSRIAYDSSAQANERRLANSERERNARQILDDMKRQRGNK